ncbi:MAG TPA: patatin-like phospholipase family protein [Planktothrix sp.]
MKTHVQVLDCKSPAGINHWVLGAGGWNLFFHLGVMKAADELGVAINEDDDIIGASCGSLIGAFIKNGFKWNEIAPIFIEMRNARSNPAVLAMMFNPFADPLVLMTGGFFNARPYIQQLVDNYNLKPKKGLRILACDALRHEPVIFAGDNYDLAFALTASGAVPTMVQPLWYYEDGIPKLLVDGAAYHYNPTEFTCGTAIVSKFRKMSVFPSDLTNPVDAYFAARELYFPTVGNNRYVDDVSNIVIETGFANVSPLNPTLSEDTCWKMIESGYNTAMPILQKAIAEGRVTVRERN